MKAIRLAIERAGTGVCTDCGSINIASPKAELYTRCRECLDRKNQRARAAKESGYFPPNHEKYARSAAKRAKERVAEKKAQGLCTGKTGCCNNKPVPGRERCQDCLDYSKAAQAKYWAKKQSQGKA